MGIFKKQIPRLEREKWQNADELSEELVAIFAADDEIVIDSPVKINNPTDQPSLTINRNSDGNALTFNYGGTTVGGITIGPNSMTITGDTLNFTGDTINIAGDTVNIPGATGSDGKPGPPGKDGHGTIVVVPSTDLIATLTSLLSGP